MPGKENHNRIFDSIVHHIMHISHVAALLLLHQHSSLPFETNAKVKRKSREYLLPFVEVGCLFQ